MHTFSVILGIGRSSARTLSLVGRNPSPNIPSASARHRSFYKKNHQSRAQAPPALIPCSSWLLTLISAGVEAAQLAHSQGETRPHTSRAPPAQLAVARAELTRVKLAPAGMELAHIRLMTAGMELTHAQLTADLTPHTSRAPPS